MSLINRVFNYANRRECSSSSRRQRRGRPRSRRQHLRTTASQPHVVCVSAVGPQPLATANPDEPTFYTNFGRSAISVAAPGGNADVANGLHGSVWPWGPDIASWVWSFCSKTRRSPDSHGAVVGSSPAASRATVITGDIGTSQASAARRRPRRAAHGREGQRQPSQIKSAIVKSAIDLGQPGTDPFYGRGRINVAKALGL